MPGGRNSLYTPARVAKICKAIENGETYEKAAQIGGLSETQFYEWRKTHPEFAEAVKRAKDAYEEWQLNDLLQDAKKSLKTLICGQEYEEIKTEYENDAHGNPRIKKQARTTKKILPNATAVIFALCNRDPEHWKNRIDTELSGKVETEAKSDVSLSNVPDELLGQLIEAIAGR